METPVLHRLLGYLRQLDAVAATGLDHVDLLAVPRVEVHQEALPESALDDVGGERASDGVVDRERDGYVSGVDRGMGEEPAEDVCVLDMDGLLSIEWRFDL